jgi:hypothetical protein
MGDSLMVLMKEQNAPYTRLLRVRTDRALAEPQLIGGCSHGADRIAVDAKYVYLPCMGSLSADTATDLGDPPRNPDGYLSAIPLDGGDSRLLVPHARRPFWVGVDTSFVYWFDRHDLARLPRPKPDVTLDATPPERIAQRPAGRSIFASGDGTYFQHGQDISRATPGHIDVWKVAGLSTLLGTSPRNDVLIELQGRANEVLRFVPESGAVVPVAKIDAPVIGILSLHDGSMLIRSPNTIWRTAVGGDSTAASALWRRMPHDIAGWAADERTLYLALQGSPLNPHRGFGLYALPLDCAPPVGAGRVGSGGGRD